MLRVGRLCTINVLPIFAGLKAINADLPNIEWVSGTPAELSRLFLNGELDVSFLPLPSYLSCPSLPQPAGNFCVSAHPQAHTVSLYTRKPIKELHHHPVHITTQSRASVQLLRVLCKHFWKVHPHFFLLEGPPTPSLDAYLLIGDQCMHHSPPKGYERIDLAQAWRLATGLPFTFALLVQQTSLSKEKQASSKLLIQALNLSHQWFLSHRDQVAAEAAKQSHVEKAFFDQYYQDLHYKLSKHDVEAIQLFNSYYKPFNEQQRKDDLLPSLSAIS